MSVAVTVDTTNAKKKAKSIHSQFRSMWAMNARTAGKMASYFCHEYTYIAKESTIEEDVRKAYPTKADDNWEGKAFKIIEEHKGEKRAKQWWNAYKKEVGSTSEREDLSNLGYEQKFDQMRFPPGVRTAKEEKYLAFLKANNKKIPHAIGIASENSRAVLMKKRKGTRGLAQIAWKAAYYALGGKGNTVSEMGTRQRKWPKELIKVYNKFGKDSLGGASVQITEGSFHVTLQNRVRYMDTAFEEWGRSRVNVLTEKYMKILFDLKRKNMKRMVEQRIIAKKAA